MQKYASFVLRLGIGVLFLVMGIRKLVSPEKVVGMVGNIGFPAPVFWAGVLIAAEVLCGLAILLGFRLSTRQFLL